MPPAHGLGLPWAAVQRLGLESASVLRRTRIYEDCLPCLVKAR